KQTVAGARRGIGVDLATGERKPALGHHRREVGGARQVGQLEAARRARRRQIRVPGDDGDDPTVTANRNRLFADWNALTPLGVTLAADPAFAPGAVEERAFAFDDPLAHFVLDVRRLRRHGPDLGNRDEAVGV